MITDQLALPAVTAGRATWGPVVISTPAAFGLAVLSGLAYATGFPPLSWSIAPWLALTLLAYAEVIRRALK